MMRKRFPHKENVLLVNITRLGDMLQATPTIAGMKQENPDCKITVLVEKQFENICRILPNIDEVKSVDLGMIVRSITRQGEGIIDAYEYLSEVVDDLKDQSFDYCLNMSSSAYTALLLRLVGIAQNGGWTADDEGYRVIESEWAQLFATSVFHRNREYNSLNLVDVFRCSADVEKHPNHLLVEVDQESLQYCETFLKEANFKNDGPLVTVQAGASQGKRQWDPNNFSRMINILTEQHNCRIVFSGTKKELPIIERIATQVDPQNTAIAAGKTNLSQLAALLKLSEVLVTGDTGPMHVSVASGTPVVSMFLASAFGFETGPYGPENLVLQPVLGCGPCNPNKSCARPDCHDHVSPELMAELVVRRLAGPVRELPAGLADPSRVLVYRTFFDEFGFYDMEPLNGSEHEGIGRYRRAYRKLWLDELAGYNVGLQASSSLTIIEDGLNGLEEAITAAQQGLRLIGQLKQLIADETSPPAQLGVVSEALSTLDRQIEEIGFQNSPLGPLTRMFVFAKENLSGTEPFELASQMEEVYRSLERRARKLSAYYHSV